MGEEVQGTESWRGAIFLLTHSFHSTHQSTNTKNEIPKLQRDEPNIKMANKNLKNIIVVAGTITAASFAVMGIVAKKKKPGSVYDDNPEEKNPIEGKKVVFVEDEADDENADGAKGHLEAVGKSEYKGSFYDKYGKRAIDIFLSGMGLVILSPVFAGISLAIKIDDPGPVLFTQKRVGKDKQYFKLHKFRSMKMSTPHDVPTHMLENPDEYITKVGRFLRKHSLDELPQIWDIFIGNMSVIGPRPALWNQDVLTAERDKYGANDIKPGLTGWAQINGRDGLEIEDKAKLDGEYVKEESLKMDAKCFLGSVGVFKGDKSVVEGGTGEIHKENKLRPRVPENDPVEDFGFKKTFNIDKDKHKHIKVLVVGAGSYIGETFKSYAAQHYPNIEVTTVGTMNGEWKDIDFSQYDTIYDVAGIAHADVGNVSDEVKEKYYAVNTDLTLEIANKAREDNKDKKTQFIFMSSAIIYGDSAPYGKTKMIDEDTVPSPANFYGDSKWQADKGVRALASDHFTVAVLRPPMIYGKGSKGNYPTLAKLAKKLPIFPDVDNERSMLYVGNLCEFLCQLMLSGEGGIYFPQNSTYTKTSEMVKDISKVAGKGIIETKALNLAVKLGQKVPGKIGGLVDKAFGNLTYDQKLSTYDGIEYQKSSLKESIELTEGKPSADLSHIDPSFLDTSKYSVLMSVYAKERPEYLKQAVDSMLAQSIKPDEIIIVEDGPLTEELNKVIKNYKNNYPELFTIIPLAENGGLGRALNFGIVASRNELIARMDTDDVSLPSRCEEQLKAFKENPNLTICGTQIREFIDTTDNVVPSRVVPCSNEEIKQFAKRRSPFNHPTVMYRKSKVLSFNGYSEYGRKEDLDLFCRMAFSDVECINLPTVLLMYRTSEDNMKRRKTWKNCSEYIEIMNKFYRKHQIGINDMIYVFVGQIAMYLMPSVLAKKMSNRYLRK